MNYHEYRASFASEEEFKKAFGKLTEEEAIELISACDSPVFIKACMLTTWRECRESCEEVDKKE